MSWSSINSSDILWGLIQSFIGPGIVFMVSVALFSYLIRIGKKKIGIWLGAALVIIAAVWLILNFTR